MKKKKKQILICVTGGISVYKACELVRSLMKKNHLVRVIMTREAAKFVTELTFRNLTNQPVAVDMFSNEIEWDPGHISLAGWADVIAVVPATANFIGKVANGICDDLPGCVIMAAKSKVLFAPAMNTNMFNHPALQNNLKKIKSFGYTIISPIKGKLACGTNGVGHLADISSIASEIEKLAK